MFAKVLLAIAILVANGVLLFVILRFLLWLAFPGKRDEEAAVVAAKPAAGAATTTAAGGQAATVAAAVAATSHPPQSPAPPPTPGMPVLTATSVGRARAYPHRLLIGLPVILALFAGGVWLGSVVGGSGAAAAATRTIHVTGTVITVDKKAVVSVPSTTVVVKGSIVSVPATTVTLPPQAVTRVVRRTVTTVHRLPGKTITTATTIAIPTTVTAPGTTITSVVTTTETVTSGTSTTSTSSTT